jgi:hypothetical protein
MPLLSALRRRVYHPNHAGLYAYHQGDVFLPGALDKVFEPSFLLPLIEVQGYGIIAGNAPSARQTPQVWAQHTAPTSGMGGLIAG